VLVTDSTNTGIAFKPINGYADICNQLLTHPNIKAGLIDIKDIHKLLITRYPRTDVILCDNQIDAFVYVAGHPNGAIREATNSCDVKLLSLPAELIANILKAHPEYSATTIAGGLYRDNDSDINTFGVTSALLTTDKLDDETAYQIVKATMENLTQLERSHPALKGLKPENMTHVGLTVPLHPGAARYYREHKIKM
jgi:TRAP transporter TAXI family solute receptor